MTRHALCVIAWICVTLAGCATTRVEIAGTELQGSLCPAGDDASTVQVYWTVHWRPDQKEPARREAAARRGIRDFFTGLACLSAVDIRRLPGESSAVADFDAGLPQLAAGVSPVPDRILLIVVRELGPQLVIGIPALVSGGTEVVIEVRVFDGHTLESMADVRTHWQNGGRFVIKGVGTLDRDMSAALRATLMPATASP